MSTNVDYPLHQVRAVFDDDTITVYQAYCPEIAIPAIAANRFVPPFGLHRMSWIKPSFLWMMYRSGWATKPGQEHVLAITMTRKGFEEALSLAVLSHFDENHYDSQQSWKALLKDSPVRIQWDPERTITGAPLPYRSLQIGLSGHILANYVDEWTVQIEDITDFIQTLHPKVESDPSLLPQEHPYPLPQVISARIGANG
ncbi:MAG: DUF4291 domain-containing protein [Propionibacteriaceae bacterium]|nr:DUF4291 domain-containing protein [Propionibacteriaceae bacterium]